MMAKRVMTEPCMECREAGKPYGGHGRCASCYMRLRRADPIQAERSRAVARRWKDRNREANRARDRAHYYDTKDPCPYCGALKDSESVACIGCKYTAAEVRQSIGEGIWADGWSAAEFLDLIGMNTSMCRKSGWDLPRRYPVDENGRRIAA